MGNIEYQLIEETSRFIGICQEWAKENKLTAAEYYNLTDKKIEFIRNITESESTRNKLDTKLLEKIKTLLTNDKMISNKLKLMSEK